jgi:hypothetical protein
VGPLVVVDAGVGDEILTKGDRKPGHKKKKIPFGHAQ